MTPGAMPGDAYGLPREALERIVTVLSAQPGIGRAILFGSRAKGNYRAGSDIDLCLEAPELKPSERLALETALDDLLLPWRIDLLLRHEIENPDVLDHIDRVGKLFWVNPAA